MAPIIIGSVIVFGSLVGVFGFKGCSTPKYKAGDCVAYNGSTVVEEWEKKGSYRSTEMILEVGKEKYRTVYWHGSGFPILVGKETGGNEIWWIDKYWFKINCETLVPE